ncbi:hypothetical protein [Rhizobium oryzicola]|uniref:J domain-containing protein n=1 Tax=Rhizobium oryzicola TaxID=1232668 RepID=A0ABT8SWF8_9HYPH|nr:hypothetical protein [Rhizobium oryzicola]MDO1582218.1 hypothetical protein [Rhizobium oryzicola]
MLFGRSVFQSILTRLDEESPEPQPEAAPGFRVRGLSAGFVAETVQHVPTGEPDLAYRHFLEADADEITSPAAEQVVEPPAPKLPPPHLLRLSEAEIGEDLGLTPRDDAEMLADKRRRFARDNHPDRVAPEFREAATRRMTVANMLVDQALRLDALQRKLK